MNKSILGLMAGAFVMAIAAPQTIAAEGTAVAAPQFKIDYNWPKRPLPNKWAIGELGGMFIDDKDHVWINNRPSTLFEWEKAASLNPPMAGCCIPAPPVIEFDPDGNVVQAWGGPGQGYNWPTTEHGIAIDPKGNVWVGGSNTRDIKDADGKVTKFADGQILKFTHDGKFLMQIGKPGVPAKGSLDQTQVYGAADIAFDAAANEVFVADGYGNHRIAVFDMDTGKFKRTWGAYGKPPTDERIGRYDPAAPAAQQFRNVHCVKISKDGFVYVCDRDNDRMQVFKKDGTFVKEYRYGTETREPGTVGHIAFWPDASQSLLALADLGNFQIRIVRRADGQVLSTFGNFGHYSGELNRMHQIAFDSKGNLYTAEAAGKRVQKFTLVGGASPK